MSGWAWLAVGALGVSALLWLVGMFCGGYELSGAVLRGLLRMGHCDDPWADARGSRRRRRGDNELDDGDDPWNGTRAAPPRDFAPSAPAVGDAVRLLVPLPASACGPTVPRGTQGVVMDVADLGTRAAATWCRWAPGWTPSATPGRCCAPASSNVCTGVVGQADVGHLVCSTVAGGCLAGAAP